MCVQMNCYSSVTEELPWLHNLIIRGWSVVFLLLLFSFMGKGGVGFVYQQCIAIMIVLLNPAYD